MEKREYYYFIGIGGVSMSGLAELLQKEGFLVAGSDMKESATTKYLREKGISVDIGHRKENITEEVTKVVYTVAIAKDNPEYLEAEEKKIPLIVRGELLGTIMKRYSNSIAISGTHGKTTTTSMIAQSLLTANLDPTITVGGILPNIGSYLRIGESSYFVAEACEYHNSFLHLNPYVGIILNLEEDHLDFFNSLEEIQESFLQFTKQIDKDGLLICNAGLDIVERVKEEASSQTVETVFIETEIEAEIEVEIEADWIAKNMIYEETGGSTFDVWYKGNFFDTFHLNIPGDYNILNALCTIASTHFLKVDRSVVKQALEEFYGAERRFQRKGNVNGVEVIDDYAHHPTEIKATLSALKTMQYKKRWCVFQPHTYSRTKFLLQEFATAFTDADEIIITEIFPAREPHDPTIHSEMLADLIQKDLIEKGKSVRYIQTFEAVVSYLKEQIQKGDCVMTIGAGDVYLIGEMLLKDDNQLSF